MIIMGLNPLNPFDENFNDITVITNKDIYSTNYVIFALFSLINIMIIFNTSINDLNNKYEKFHMVLYLAFFELTFSLISHIIGYNIFKIFSDEKIEFYTYKTFLVGIASSLFIIFNFSLAYLVFEYFLLPLSEQFYDKQFGQ
jgi:hypothetical protein